MSAIWICRQLAGQESTGILGDIAHCFVTPTLCILCRLCPEGLYEASHRNRLFNRVALEKRS